MPRTAAAATSAALALLLLAASVPAAYTRALVEAEADDDVSAAPAPADAGADAPAPAPAAEIGTDISISGGAALLSASCQTDCYDPYSPYFRCEMSTPGQCKKPVGCNCHPPNCLNACLYYCSCTDPECMTMPDCGGPPGGPPAGCGAC